MSEEIRRAFKDKDFSYISEVAIVKNRSKIKISAFEQLFHKFNDTSEKTKKYNKTTEFLLWMDLTSVRFIVSIVHTLR